MKFHETEFARQLLGVVLGTLFVVASVAFVSIPLSFGCAAASTAWHLT